MRLMLGRVAEEVMMASNCWETGAGPRGVFKGKIDQEEWFLRKRARVWRRLVGDWIREARGLVLVRWG